MNFSQVKIGAPSGTRTHNPKGISFLDLRVYQKFHHRSINEFSCRLDDHEREVTCPCRRELHPAQENSIQNGSPAGTRTRFTRVKTLYTNPYTTGPFNWCGRQGSNLHGFLAHKGLSLARLPTSPLPQKTEEKSKLECPPRALSP